MKELQIFSHEVTVQTIIKLDLMSLYPTVPVKLGIEIWRKYAGGKIFVLIQHLSKQYVQC